MRCPRCASENAERAKFCAECGARLAAACPACGAEAAPGAKFCSECGHRLAEPAPAAATPATGGAPAAPATAGPAGTAPPARRSPPPTPPAGYTPKHLAEKILRSRSALEGERRQVTVLFADIAGFTALAEQLDPEDVHRIVDRCFELITAEVHRLEGTINQYTGDGVMALFGAPIAHEDASRRAVHAALGIQRALRELAAELAAERGIALQMRIGVNTGPVVVGRIGDDLRMDYTAVGDTTNLAARLQQAARPGSVLVSEATHREIGGYFETLDLGPLEVKGHAPVRAFEVLRPRGRRSRLDVAAERGLTPLVGRDRELSLLRQAFRHVKGGRGQVVVLVGDAGIGKSRLLLEFQRLLAAEGEAVTWLEGQCVSFGQAVPFLPLIDQLRRNFRIEEFDGEPEIIAKVEHGMRRMGGLEPHIPFVRSILAVDPGDPAVAAMAPADRRRRVFEAARALSLRGAQLRPLVLVYEDLHWVDHGTEEYLSWLIDAVAGYPVMVVLTHRPGYTPSFASRSYQTALTLQSLSDAEVRAMAAQLLGVSALPRDVLDPITAKAEGVPLFVEEVAKTLTDLGVLRRENGGYRLVRGADAVGVPDTIQGIIMARLDRLGENGKRTVQLASVIGRQFLVRLLERLSEFKGELEGLLRELRQLEIIYELGLTPEPAYIFKHAVIQDVAYQSLLLQRRKELHRAVGHAIEELYPDRLAEHYEELAHHFLHGEAWGRALEYLVRSGDKAKDAYANHAALEAYGRALEVAPRVVPPVAPRRLVEIHQRRGQVLLLLSRYREAVEAGERMVAIAAQAGDRRGEAEGLVDQAYAHWMMFSAPSTEDARRCAEAGLAIAREVDDQRLIAKSLTYLGITAQANGDLLDADAKLEESLRIAHAGEHRDAVATNLVWLGAHANWRGEFAKAIPLTQQAGEAAVAVHDGFQELLAASFQCLGHIGLGEHGRALAVIAETLGKARDRGNTFIVGRLTNTLGWLHQELGDFTGAQQYDREGADIGQRAKNANVEISSLINLGYDHFHLGDSGQALAVLEDALDRVERFAFGAHRWRWSMHLHLYLAEVLLAQGDADRALAEAERGQAIARATSSLKYVARSHVLRGEAALAAGAAGPAADELAEALRLAQRIRYPTLTWQAAHALARALARHAVAGGGAAAAERAHEAAQLAAATIRAVAEGLPDPALARSFAAWRRVQAAQEDAERMARR